MKTKGIFLLGALSLAFLAACQDDNDNTPVTTQGDLANVTFEIDASSISTGVATRTITPQYSEAGFSIYAYKKTGDGDYVFNKTISLTNTTYTPDTKTLTGTDNLEIGTYKFVPAYGVKNQSSSVLDQPIWGNSMLGDDLLLTFKGGTLGEIFLATDKNAGSLTAYEFAITEAANTKVQATLKRAVSRVDLMFISADKVGNTYVEKEYFDSSSDIFGGKELQNIQLQFAGINNKMNLFGVDATTVTFDANFNLGNFSETVVVGSGTSTEVGKNDYVNYDNIQAGDIITGSAHVFGTYLFPSKVRSAGLRIVLTPTNGEARVITVSNKGGDTLPIEQNKVTLVKIYVLKDNNVFSTTAEFEVVIDTVWGEANEVEGSIS